MIAPRSHGSSGRRAVIARPPRTGDDRVGDRRRGAVERRLHGVFERRPGLQSAHPARQGGPLHGDRLEPHPRPFEPVGVAGCEAPLGAGRPVERVAPDDRGGVDLGERGVVAGLACFQRQRSSAPAAQRSGRLRGPVALRPPGSALRCGSPAEGTGSSRAPRCGRPDPRCSRAAGSRPGTGARFRAGAPPRRPRSRRGRGGCRAGSAGRHCAGLPRCPPPAWSSRSENESDNRCTASSGTPSACASPRLCVLQAGVGTRLGQARLGQAGASDCGLGGGCKAALEPPLEERQLLLPQGDFSAREPCLLGSRVAVDVATLHAAACLPCRRREIEQRALRHRLGLGDPRLALAAGHDREVEDQAHGPGGRLLCGRMAVVLTAELDGGVRSLRRGHLARRAPRPVATARCRAPARGRARPT